MGRLVPGAVSALLLLPPATRGVDVVAVLRRGLPRPRFFGVWWGFRLVTRCLGAERVRDGSDAPALALRRLAVVFVIFAFV